MGIVLGICLVSFVYLVVLDVLYFNWGDSFFVDFFVGVYFGGVVVVMEVV